MCFGWYNFECTLKSKKPLFLRVKYLLRKGNEFQITVLKMVDIDASISFDLVSILK